MIVIGARRYPIEYQFARTHQNKDSGQTQQEDSHAIAKLFGTVYTPQHNAPDGKSQTDTQEYQALVEGHQLVGASLSRPGRLEKSVGQLTPGLDGLLDNLIVGLLLLVAVVDKGDFYKLNP